MRTRLLSARQSTRLVIFGMSALAVVLATLLSRSPLLLGLEERAEDYRQRERILGYGGVRLPVHKVRALNERGEATPDPRTEPLRYADCFDVVIIGMDDDSIQRRDGTPFSPEEHARVVDALTKLGARVIVFDMLFSEERRKLFDGGLQPLADATVRARDAGVPVVVGWKYDFNDAGQFVPVEALPVIADVAGEGCLNVSLNDRTVSVRDYQYVHEVGGEGGKPRMSLALAAYALALNPGDEDAAYRDLIAAREKADDSIALPIVRDGEKWQLNFYGPTGTFPRVKYADVYDVAEALDDARIREAEAQVATRQKTANDNRRRVVSALPNGAPVLDAMAAAIKAALAQDPPDDEAIDIAIEDAEIALDDHVAEAGLNADALKAYRNAFNNYAILLTVIEEERAELAALRAQIAGEISADERELVARLRPLVRNKVALIGPWALDFHDVYVTPTTGLPSIAHEPGADIDTTRMYGVELHATAIQNAFEMLGQNEAADRRGLTHVDNTAKTLIAIGVALLAALLAMALPPLVGIIVLFISAAGYALLSRQVFLDHATFIPLAGPLMGASLSYVMMSITRILTVDRERRKVDRLFKNYVDRRFVEILKADPSKINLGGDRKELSIFFSDVAGFSSISEKLTPEQLVELLNEYLGTMTDIILKHDGTIDKYIGDAIMAFWNAPLDVKDHARKACQAALEQRAKLKELQIQWALRGFPRVDARMGINTGVVVHANVGSKMRKNYTLMGDNVNLAARFEPLNKDFGTAIIIGERTTELAGDAIVARRLGVVQVKGRTKPVGFYELIAMRGDVSDKTLERIDRFHAALDLYVSGDFAAAEPAFERVLELERADGPAMTYLALTRQLLAAPPKKESWTGIFEQTHK